jgi:hypothetical protein
MLVQCNGNGEIDACVLQYPQRIMEPKMIKYVIPPFSSTAPAVCCDYYFVRSLPWSARIRRTLKRPAPGCRLVCEVLYDVRSISR